LTLHAAESVADFGANPASSQPAADLARDAALMGAPRFESDLAVEVEQSSGKTYSRAAVLALPLRSAGRVVGVINLSFYAGRGLKPEDWALADRLNEQAAIAIDSVWLFEFARRQLQELTVLHLVAVAAAESATEDELIGRATQLIGAELFPDNF